MKTSTIDISNRDTFLHIDTYGMFTLESEDEREREYWTEQIELEREQASTGIPAELIDLDDYFDVEYHMEDYRRALAGASVAWANDNLTGPVIEKIELIEGTIGSPKYYNYTTDYYTATWSYNPEALLQYTMERLERFLKWAGDAWSLINFVMVDNKLMTRELPYTEPMEWVYTPALEYPDAIACMIDYYTRQSMIDAGYTDYEYTYFVDMLELTHEDADEAVEYIRKEEAKEATK